MLNKTNRNLLVTRDGNLDDEYLEAMIAAERRELLKQYGKDALKSVGRGTITLGKGIVWLMTPENQRSTSQL